MAPPLSRLGDVLLDHDRREILFLELFGRAVDPSGGTRKSALAVPATRAIVWLGLHLWLPVRYVDLVDPKGAILLP